MEYSSWQYKQRASSFADTTLVFLRLCVPLGLFIVDFLFVVLPAVLGLEHFLLVTFAPLLFLDCFGLSLYARKSKWSLLVSSNLGGFALGRDLYLSLCGRGIRSANVLGTTHSELSQLSCLAAGTATVCSRANDNWTSSDCWIGTHSSAAILVGGISVVCTYPDC